MNRCIACYRCTRFYNDYAGGRDFGAFASRNRVFFGRAAAGTLESPFAGQPRRGLPDGRLRRQDLLAPLYAQVGPAHRPFRLRPLRPRVQHDPGERYGSLRRIRNRYNGSVNGYFLCDRGRYGYAFVNGERRIREPRLRREKALGLHPVSAEEAVSAVAGILASAGRVVGIGSPRASLEANFALRTLVGPEPSMQASRKTNGNACPWPQSSMQREGALAPSLSDIARCDAVLILGEDISNTAPMLHLQVLQSQRVAAIETAAKFHIHEWDDTAVRVAAGGARSPSLSRRRARRTWTAARLPPSAPPRQAWPASGMHAAHLIDEARRLFPTWGLRPPLRLDAASALIAAETAGHYIRGRAAGTTRVIEAAANIVCALRRAGKEAYLCLAGHECNSAGLALMADKALDGPRPMRKAGTTQSPSSWRMTYTGAWTQRSLERFFGAFRHVIAIDHTLPPDAPSRRRGPARGHLCRRRRDVRQQRRQGAARISGIPCARRRAGKLAMD